MGALFAVLSGKGGTGKTSVCAGIAVALAEEGNRVLCIDCDVGLRNLDISLGITDTDALSFLDISEGGYSLEQAAKLGAGAVCFEGNIDFYGKSGFTYASRYGIRYHGLPEGEDASFFLCKDLIPGYLDGITGEYATPSGYFVDEGDAEEFDKQFPPKEKLKLPGQLW